MKKPQTETTNRHLFLKCIDPNCPSQHDDPKLNYQHVRSDNYKARGHKDCKHSIICVYKICTSQFKVPEAPMKIQKNLIT